MRQHHQNQHYSHIQGEQGRQKLRFGHPPQPRTKRAAEVEQKQRYPCKEYRSKDYSCFSEHRSNSVFVYQRKNATPPCDGTCKQR